MFKGTSEALNHIARVASASTRPHANGRIDLIPENAREPEEYYNTVRDQYFVLNATLKSRIARLTEIKARLKETIPYREFQELSREREGIAATQNDLQKQCVELRALVRASGKHAWAVTFHAIAERVLERELFKKLEKEVEAILGRPVVEVAKGEAEWSATKRAGKQRNDRQSQRRKYVREKMRVRAIMAERTA